MKRWLLALLLGVASLGCLDLSPAAATVRTSPTVFRTGGFPLRVLWTARVHEGGTFALYRHQHSGWIEVTTIPARVGRQTYRIEDSGNLDSSADYELRWRSESGDETTVGALRCERNSACKPLSSPSHRHNSWIAEALAVPAPIDPTREDSPGCVAAGEPTPGFASIAHPPPRPPRQGMS